MTARRAEFLAIGSELLEPWRVDTNGSFVSRRLGEIGIAVRYRTVVGDDRSDLREAFRIALGRSDLVIATGGLGPTIDDLTREALAELLGLSLREDPALVRRLEERFRKLGSPMPPSNRRQAQVLEGADVIPNALGSAPGMLVRSGAALVVLLPGVPYEMRPMLEQEVLPRLGPTGERFVHAIFKIAGLTESEADRRLAEVARDAGDVAWTILAAPGQVEIHLRERVSSGGAAEGIARLGRGIESALGAHLFARDDDTMEQVIGRLLLAAGATAAVGESLTGGLIAARLTAPPGASRWCAGGAVCYSDAAKQSVLGVERALLRTHGTVSVETARAMAEGARRVFGSAWGIAATGCAGPDAVEGKPPGTVVLAASGSATTVTRSLLFPGDRETIRARAAQSALDLLRRALMGVTA